MKSQVVIGGVLVAGAVLALTGQSGIAGANYKLSPQQTYDLADQITRRHFPHVNPLMLTTMARIESSFKVGAIRTEPHLNDASIGLMQTLYNTARWLHDDMGYRAYELKSPDDLTDPQVSMYFGGAMVAWLSRYRGKTRNEDWIVMSYNGGPNADNAMTRNHLGKYKQAKQELRNTLKGVI